MDELDTIQQTVTLTMSLDDYQAFMQAVALVDYASRVVIVWGTALVPLLIIVVMLWWFFKQFLYRY